MAPGQGSGINSIATAVCKYILHLILPEYVVWYQINISNQLDKPGEGFWLLESDGHECIRLEVKEIFVERSHVL